MLELVSGINSRPRMGRPGTKLRAGLEGRTVLIQAGTRQGGLQISFSGEAGTHLEEQGLEVRDSAADVFAHGRVPVALHGYSGEHARLKGLCTQGEGRAQEHRGSWVARYAEQTAAWHLLAPREEGSDKYGWRMGEWQCHLEAPGPRPGG